MIKTLFAWLAVPSLAAFAAPLAFDFKDPLEVNHVRFHLDAPVEPVSGTVGGITGTVVFDPANPSTTSGRIVVKADTLRLPNERMQGSLHSPKGIDVAQYPEISFEATRIANVRTLDAEIVADVTGTFSLRGVTKEITVPVRFSYMPDALGRRQPGAKGDLLVMRAEFTITREEFGIRPGEYLDKVSNEIKLTLAIVGAARRD